MRHAAIVLNLKSLPLFDRLSAAQVSRIAGRVKEVHFAAGDHVVEEGEHDAAIFLVVDGTAQAMRGETLLGEIAPGDVFGEVAVFDGSTRSATVVARSPMHLLRLERHDLLHVMEEHPRIGIALCEALSRRLRSLSERLTV